MRFKRSKGITPSEKILADLCDDSFLTLWSYPNLFRKPGKELCDLLVVFGHHQIIFSDKSCAYPDTEDAALNWSRWYRRSIVDSANSIRRAEGWLATCPERVFLDSRCTEPFPIMLPARDCGKVHRVCIALGAAQRALAATGKASLGVSADVVGDAEAFVVGHVPEAKGWVHIFDEHTLPVVLSELSTVTDFVDYLAKKEALITSGRFVEADSELDMLAYFLWNGREFPAPGIERFKLDPGLWEKVEVDAAFLAARKQNEVGSFWDGLIEYLTGHYMQEELERGNELSVGEYEQMLRVMAAETRFSRRMLAKWILERAEMAKDGYVGSMFPSLQSGVLYVLLIGPGDGGAPHDAYRRARSDQLYARCIAAKAAQPDRDILVGIAMDARDVKGTSEDFLYMDVGAWTAEQLQAAEALRQELGYFIEGRIQDNRTVESEYPGT